MRSSPNLVDLAKIAQEKINLITVTDLINESNAIVNYIIGEDCDDPGKYLHDQILALVKNRNDHNICMICNGETNGWYHMCRKCWEKF